MDGNSDPRHSRARENPTAWDIRTGMARYPCGWIAANRKLLTSTLKTMLSQTLQAAVLFRR